MRVLVVLGLLLALARCLDFDGAAEDYCVRHPTLCSPDAGADGGG